MTDIEAAGAAIGTVLQASRFFDVALAFSFLLVMIAQLRDSGAW